MILRVLDLLKLSNTIVLWACYLPSGEAGLTPGLGLRNMRIETGLTTHQGIVRSSNQDTIAIIEPQRSLFGRQGLWLFVVADGMGGHHGGEVASSLAVQTMKRVFGEQSRRLEPGEALKLSMQEANKAILLRGKGSPILGKMGTTVVAATVTVDSLHLCNVGDSRAYLLRDGEIRRLTEDHSLVSEQVRAGLISEDDPAARRNILTRSVGRTETIEVDLFEESWQVGDVIMLCSDGLWGVIPDAQIATVLRGFAPQQASKELVQMAMENHSADNISAVVVKRLS